MRLGAVTCGLMEMTVEREDLLAIVADQRGNFRYPVENIT